MSYRLLAPLYDWVAPNVSRYRSPRLLTSKVLAMAPDPCELLDIGVGTGLSIAPYVDTPRFRRIVGVDPSAAMLARCRRKFPSVALHHGTLDEVTGLVRQVAELLKPGGYVVFTYEPTVLFSLRQSKQALHIGTFGRETVFRRTPHEIHAALTQSGLHVSDDLEFKAYLGLVHHLVIARSAPSS